MPSTVERKQTQHQRILAATIEILAYEGYAATTIGQIIAEAGVSRPTFYDYFADKDACLVGAIAAVNEQLLAQVEAAVRGQAPERASFAAIEAIFAFCSAQPAMARVLLDASLAGPAPALDARGEGIAALAGVVDGVHCDVPTEIPIPDIADDVLIAGIYRLLAARVRQGSRLDGEALSEILSWVQSYAAPAPERRWSTLKVLPAVAVTRVLGEPPFGHPPLAPASHFPGGRVAYHRQRLLFAAAELAKEKRLRTARIADITKRAKVGYRTFSRLFASKQDLLIVLHELGHMRTLAATTGAYFSSAPWPERVWAAGQAYTQYVAENPTIAHVGFLEPYAAGARGAQSMDNVLGTFTVFLAEGDVNVPAGRERPSRLAFDAIAATIFDFGFQAVRSGNGAELPALLPQAVFLVLAPFLGVEEAWGFVEGKVGAVEAG
jgi:AcrR family transcriptional regulator